MKEDEGLKVKVKVKIPVVFGSKIEFSAISSASSVSLVGRAWC